MPEPQERAYRPQLIVIGGLSGSGKSTLARGLADALSLPLLSKDIIKEALFDSLGWSDRTWSQRLGAAAIAVLYRQLEQLLATRQSCIIESIFRAELDGPRLRALCAQHRIQPVEIQYRQRPSSTRSPPGSWPSGRMARMKAQGNASRVC